MPISMLPPLADPFGVTFEELIGAPVKRGPAPKLQQQLERITALPNAQ